MFASVRCLHACARAFLGGVSMGPMPTRFLVALLASLSLNAVSIAQTCVDGVWNGDEEYIDCGGSCPDECCPACVVSSECVDGGVCHDGRCQPTTAQGETEITLESGEVIKGYVGCDGSVLLAHYGLGARIATYDQRQAQIADTNWGGPAPTDWYPTLTNERFGHLAMTRFNPAGRLVTMSCGLAVDNVLRTYASSSLFSSFDSATYGTYGAAGSPGWAMVAERGSGFGRQNHASCGQLQTTASGGIAYCSGGGGPNSWANHLVSYFTSTSWSDSPYVGCGGTGSNNVGSPHHVWVWLERGCDRDCDDGNACTVDTCDAETAACVHNRANEGDMCSNGIGACRDGQCVPAPVEPRADLELLTLCRPTPPCPNGTVRCDIHAYNRGPSSVPELTVEMVLTVDVLVAEADDPLKIFPGFGSPSPIGMGPPPSVMPQLVQWTASDVPAGGKAATWFSLDVGSSGGTKIVNVVGSIPDPNVGNNSNTEVFAPDPGLCPQVSFVQKAGATPRVGNQVCTTESIFYVVAYEFQSPGAGQADVVDDLDPCLDPMTVSALMPYDQCAVVDSTITCTGLTLDSGGAGQIAFAVKPRLGCAIGTDIVNEAVVTSNEGIELAGATVHHLVACEQQCSNGLDDDGDGLPDCLDSDCQDLPCNDADLCNLCNAGICEASRCCGDGSVGPGEECDDGNTISGDCCSACNAEDLGQVSCGVGECLNVVPQCTSGVPNECQPGEPTEDVCDGLDNDCNGRADDALEACNGIDDNCNGLIDESNPQGGADCTVSGELGICADGTVICTAVGLTCLADRGPGPEICGNSLDDDCDGQTDEVIDDSDADGVANCTDNCPDAFNPARDCDSLPGTPDEQCDGDGDGIGDECDCTPEVSE